jgi:hypothetical protein
MNRLLALLLLSAIGILPLGSAFASISVAGSLPACCRASGKHHCQTQHSNHKPGVRSSRQNCPCAPAISSAPVTTTMFPVPVRHLAVQDTTHYLLAQEQSGHLSRIALDRNCLKRGPPHFSRS